MSVIKSHAGLWKDSAPHLWEVWAVDLPVHVPLPGKNPNFVFQLVQLFPR